MLVGKYELKKIIGKGKYSEIYITTMKESEDIYLLDSVKKKNIK